MMRQHLELIIRSSNQRRTDTDPRSHAARAANAAVCYGAGRAGNTAAFRHRSRIVGTHRSMGTDKHNRRNGSRTMAARAPATERSAKRTNSTGTGAAKRALDKTHSTRQRRHRLGHATHRIPGSSRVPISVRQRRTTRMGTPPSDTALGGKTRRPAGAGDRGNAVRHYRSSYRRPQAHVTERIAGEIRSSPVAGRQTLVPARPRTTLHAHRQTRRPRERARRSCNRVRVPTHAPRTRSAGGAHARVDDRKPPSSDQRTVRPGHRRRQHHSAPNPPRGMGMRMRARPRRADPAPRYWRGMGRPVPLPDGPKRRIPKPSRNTCGERSRRWHCSDTATSTAATSGSNTRGSTNRTSPSLHRSTT